MEQIGGLNTPTFISLLSFGVILFMLYSTWKLDCHPRHMGDRTGAARLRRAMSRCLARGARPSIRYVGVYLDSPYDYNHQRVLHMYCAYIPLAGFLESWTVRNSAAQQGCTCTARLEAWSPGAGGFGFIVLAGSKRRRQHHDQFRLPSL